MASRSSGKGKDGKAIAPGGQDCSIKVMVRVRPPAKESGGVESVCLEVDNAHHAIIMHAKPDKKVFTFDEVADMFSTQEGVFGAVGKSIIDSCLGGYNGTIFAYGQTGSGKTFSMLGPSENSDNFQHAMRGIIPRSFEYLFNIINRKKELMGDNITFLCRCSFLEIYNEQVYDLLDPAAMNLQLRENIKKGVFVDGLTEQTVDSASQAYEVLTIGWRNRTVAATSMNRESSRSHAVFTVSIESKEMQNSVWKIRSSQLNLVDLAGSERQKDTNTFGTRLKEAGSINKSLSVLGNVIMSLVDIANGKTRHVPYRESKLCFLLRDSLGGSAKTCMVACIHPGSKCFGETLSTLQFARRAKMIKNKVVANENATGNIEALQAEVARLRNLVSSLQQGGSIPSELGDAPVSDPSDVLDENDKNEEDLPPEKLWKRNFVEAMYFREICEQKRKSLEELNKSLQEALDQKQIQLSHTQRILNFRSTFLRKIEKKELTDNAKDQEIRNLLEQLSVSEEINVSHPDVPKFQGKIKFLTEELKRLKAEGVEKVNKERAKLEELQKTFIELRSSTNLEELKKELSDNVQANQVPTPQRMAAVPSTTLKQIAEKDELIEKLEKELLEVKANLAATVKSKESLEKTLNTHRVVSRIERESIDTLHMETIKTITTPKKEKYNLRNRTILVPFGETMSPESLEDISETAPPQEYVDGLCEEIRVLKEELRENKEKLVEKDNEIAKLTESKSLLEMQKEQLDNLHQELKKTSTKSQEELYEQIKNLTEEAEKAAQALQYKTSEAQDFSIMWKCEEKRFEEAKEKFDEIQAQNAELETKLIQLEMDNFNLQKEIENTAAQLEIMKDENETLQETVAFTQSQLDEVQSQFSQEKTSNSKLELRLEEVTEQLKSEQERRVQLASQSGDREKEFLESYQQLDDELEKKKEVIEKLETTMHGLKSENVGLNEKIAQIESDIVQQKETLDNTMQLLTTERQVRKNTDLELTSVKSELEESNQQRIAVHQKLEQLEQEYAQLETKRKETEEELTNKIEALQIQIKQGETNLEMQSEDITDLHSIINQHETTMESLNNQISGMEKEKETQDEELKKFQEMVTKLREENAMKDRMYEEKLAESTDQTVKELTEQLNETRGELLKHRAEVDQLHTSLKQTLNDLNDTREQLQISQTETSCLAASRESVAKELEDLKSKTHMLESQLQDAKDRVIELEKNSEATKEYFAKLELERNKVVEEQGRIKTDLASKNVEVTRLTEELTSKAVDMERYIQQAAKDAEEIQELRSKVGNLEEQLHRVIKEKDDLEKERQGLLAQCAGLAGHANHQQKIHYVEKLKDENERLHKVNDYLKKLPSRDTFSTPRSIRTTPLKNLPTKSSLPTPKGRKKTPRLSYPIGKTSYVTPGRTNYATPGKASYVTPKWKKGCYRKHLDKGDYWKQFLPEEDILNRESAVSGTPLHRTRDVLQAFCNEDQEAKDKNPVDLQTSPELKRDLIASYYDSDDCAVVDANVLPSKETVVQYYTLTPTTPSQTDKKSWRGSDRYSAKKQKVDRRAKERSHVGSIDSLQAEQGSLASDWSQSQDELKHQKKSARKSPRSKQQSMKDEKPQPYQAMERPGWDGLELEKRRPSFPPDPWQSSFANVIVDPLQANLYFVDGSSSGGTSNAKTPNATHADAKGVKYPDFFKKDNYTTPVSQCQGPKSKLGSVGRSVGRVFPNTVATNSALDTGKAKARCLSCCANGETYNAAMKQSGRSTVTPKLSGQKITPARKINRRIFGAESALESTPNNYEMGLLGKSSVVKTSGIPKVKQTKHWQFLDSATRDKIMVTYDDTLHQDPLFVDMDTRSDSLFDKNDGNGVNAREIPMVTPVSGRGNKNAMTSEKVAKFLLSEEYGNNSNRSGPSPMSVAELKTESELWSSARTASSKSSSSTSTSTIVLQKGGTMGDYSIEDEFEDDYPVSAAPDQVKWLKRFSFADSDTPTSKKDEETQLNRSQELSFMCQNIQLGVQEMIANLHLSLDSDTTSEVRL